MLSQYFPVLGVTQGVAPTCETSSASAARRCTGTSPRKMPRERAGLAAAAANGRKGGRPRKVDDADAAKARQLRQKGITATDIAKMLDVPRHRVLLPPRGRRSLELAEPQPLLNADQAAPGPTDDGQWGDPHHLRDARQICGSLTPTPRRRCAPSSRPI